MSNTIGNLFRVTSWGESHSRAVGAVIDGCPAGLSLSEKDVESYIRKTSVFFSFSTSRREDNKIEILSGVYKNRTLGTPISLMTFNSCADSSEYLKLEGVARPSHAEYAYYKKYGIYDPRGGGRASGRECIARHMAAAVADKIIKLTDIKISAAVIELAGMPAGTKKAMELAAKKVQKLKEEKDSSGGVFEITLTGVPAGLGSPVFGKLSSQISSCLFSVGGIKSVEIGAGKDIAAMKGSRANDSLYFDEDGTLKYGSNNSGGISGGISTGAPIVVRAAVKPTPSIYQKQSTIDFYKNVNREIELKGRFDANFTPRAMAAAVSMIRIMLADNLLQMNFIKL